MFRLLAENVKDYAIFIVDPQRHILSWNKGAERLLGFTEEEIIGQKCDCFFIPEEAARDRERQLHLLTDQAPVLMGEVAECCFLLCRDAGPIFLVSKSI